MATENKQKIPARALEIAADFSRLARGQESKIQRVVKTWLAKETRPPVMAGRDSGLPESLCRPCPPDPRKDMSAQEWVKAVEERDHWLDDDAKYRAEAKALAFAERPSTAPKPPEQMDDAESIALLLAAVDTVVEQAAPLVVEQNRLLRIDPATFIGGNPLAAVLWDVLRPAEWTPSDIGSLEGALQRVRELWGPRHGAAEARGLAAPSKDAPEAANAIAELTAHVKTALKLSGMDGKPNRGQLIVEEVRKRQRDGMEPIDVCREIAREDFAAACKTGAGRWLRKAKALAVNRAYVRGEEPSKADVEKLARTLKRERNRALAVAVPKPKRARPRK